MNAGNLPAITPPVIRVIEKFPPLLGRKRLVGKDVQHAL